MAQAPTADDTADDTAADDTAPTGVAGPAGRRGTRRRSPRGARDLVEWVAIVVGALVVALLVKTFVIQAFWIPSLSMAPALEEDDRVLVNKLSYELHDVHRGDLVVFERPPNEPPSEVKDLIKRVVALEGETVEDREGRLFVDGRPLDEPYIDPTVATVNVSRQTVPPDHVFVMGDNRGDSRDSRFFGPIDTRLILGRAFVRVWPVDDLGLL